MTTQRDIDRLLGELEQHVHRETSAPVDFRSFLGRPVDFCEQVCQATLLQWQRDALTAFVTEPLISCASANSCGKTAGFAVPAILYALYVEGATCLYMTSTEKQARSQIIRELKRWLGRSAALECDVFQHGITLPTGATLVIVSPDAVESAAGFHDERLTIFCDEASSLDDEIMEAMLGNIMGEGNRLVLTGNPLRMDGPFAKTHRPGSDWHRIVVTAEDVINDPAAPLCKGLISRAGVNRLRQQYGEESAAFQARVWARSPSSPTDALYSDVMLEAAVLRWHQRTLLRIIMLPEGQLSPVDPSTNGPYNPLVAGMPVQPGAPLPTLPVSVEEVIGYLSLAQETAGIKGEAGLVSVFEKLASDVRPVALGQVYRSRTQIRMLSRKLLQFHTQADDASIDGLIETLTEKLYSHDYIITRREAKAIGLKVEEPEPALDKAMADLLELYEEDLKLREPIIDSCINNAIVRACEGGGRRGRGRPAADGARGGAG